MANWSEETKHLPESINGGKQYEAKDRVSREQLNAIVENSFYAMKKSDTANTNSENAVKTANDALAQVQGQGSKVFVGGQFASSVNLDSDPQEQLNNLDTNKADKEQLDNKANKDLSNLTVEVNILETVYDKNSSDSSINWGYTSGIKGGNDITGKDFSKYKELRVYGMMENNVGVATIDLLNINSENSYRGSTITNGGSMKYPRFMVTSVQPNKTTWSISFSQWQESVTSVSSKNNNSAYYVFKIVGVL